MLYRLQENIPIIKLRYRAHIDNIFFINLTTEDCNLYNLNPNIKKLFIRFMQSQILFVEKYLNHNYSIEN